jgi:hypothetical protein
MTLTIFSFPDSNMLTPFTDTLLLFHVRNEPPSVGILFSPGFIRILLISKMRVSDDIILLNNNKSRIM